MSRKQPQAKRETATAGKNAADKAAQTEPAALAAPESQSEASIIETSVQETPDTKPESTSSRRGTMSAKEVTSEAIRNYNNNFVDPWLKAMKSWVSESEKFQQTAIEGFNKALDNSHRLAKESIEMAASIGTTLQKQITAQVERTTELVHSMIP